MPSTTTQILTATWTPADVAVGEAVILPTLATPVGCWALGAVQAVPTPGDAGSTGHIAVAGPGTIGTFGPIGQCDLSSDTWPTPTSFPSDLTFSGPVGVAFDVTLTYTPGATPGTTKPVVKFYLLIVPNVFTAAG